MVLTSDAGRRSLYMGPELFLTLRFLIISQFEMSDHWKLIKNLFSNMFSTPKGHPKIKPFVDRCEVGGFVNILMCVVHHRIWNSVSNYAYMHIFFVFDIFP